MIEKLQKLIDDTQNFIPTGYTWDHKDDSRIHRAETRLSGVLDLILPELMGVLNAVEDSGEHNSRMVRLAMTELRKKLEGL